MRFNGGCIHPFAVHVAVLSIGVDILEGQADRTRFQELAAQYGTEPEVLALIGNASADLIWYLMKRAAC